MSAPAPRSPLSLIVGRWTWALGPGAAPGSGPLLRIERGATLLQGPRAPRVEAAGEALLALVAAHLAPAPAGLSAAVRPKVRVALSVGGAGVLLAVRWFGSAPPAGECARALPALGEGACLFPPRVRGGEVLLQAALAEPPRRMPLVHVLAGRRAVAIPLLAVERALAEDAAPPGPLEIVSLARCLDEEPVPAPGRPALLVLRRRGEPLALRVELLVGHASERVLPCGPLLQAVPWLLGVVERGDDAPEPVVDPLALARRGHAD